jgi:hypothetical protein
LFHSSFSPRCVFTRVVSLFFLLCTANATAQAIPTAPNAEVIAENGTGPAGIIPVARGFNASLITAMQHDSGNGWSSILTPGIAWRFSPGFSVNASVPVYAYVNVLQNVGTKANPAYIQQTKHGVPGDTALSATFEIHPEPVSYSATFTLGLPSGNTAYGLGAGHLGYNFNNHFEKDFGFLTPNIEAGVTNSSSLIPARGHKSYTTSGTLAHFQAGASVDLPHDISLEADAYEDMPVSTSTIYSSNGNGKRKVTIAAATSAAEDNGLTSSMDVPLNGHTTLSGFYIHSIRGQYDVGGFSLTFLLKAPPHREGTF